MNDSIKLESLFQGDPLLVLANWYTFALGETLENPQVWSRMLLWCVQGRGQVWVDGEKQILEADDYLLLPWRHRVKYQADSLEPFRVGGIHLIPHQAGGETLIYGAAHRTDDPLAQLSSRQDALWPGLEGLVIGSMRDSPRLRWLCGYLIEWASSVPPLEQPRRALAQLLIEELQQCHQNLILRRDRIPPVLRQVQDRVRENLSQVWRVKDMTALTEYSVATLHRQFMRHLGCSPLRWVAQQRLELAQKLLSTTRYPVRVVGEQVGMPDPFHFSRFFKAHTRLSPRAYRDVHNAL